MVKVIQLSSGSKIVVTEKQPANKTSREELLLRDVTQMFWELRTLRNEVSELRKENAALILKNKRLEHENDLLFLSNMCE
jgi:hypothetical protein